MDYMPPIPAMSPEQASFTPFDFIYDGMTLPISNMFDKQGCEVGDPEDAASLVAAMPDGKWLASFPDHGQIVKRRPH